MNNIKNMKLVKRDYKIIETIERFDFCLSRHIKFLADFPSARTTDRRLKLLVEHGYLKRKKIIYGMPYFYYLSKESKRLLRIKDVSEKIKLGLVRHNIFMLDYLPKLVERYNFSLELMNSEKELHKRDSFNVRQHRPDLLFIKKDQTIAIEFELTKKAKSRLIANIEKNYIDYDRQIWIVPRSQKRVVEWIEEEKEIYDGIEVIIVDE